MAWAWPEPHAVAHYREAIPWRSRHLYVLDDGRFVVDHADSWNLDASLRSWLLHGVVAAPYGRVIAGVVVPAAVALMAGAVLGVGLRPRG